MLRPTPVFHASYLLHAGARSKSPLRKGAQSRTFDQSPVTGPERLLFPLVGSRRSALNRSSPFAELIGANPDSVLGMTTLRLNLKMSQQYGMDNRDLIDTLGKDMENPYQNTRKSYLKKTFKESKMCWDYFASEGDIRNLIRAKLYNRIEEGTVSKPAKTPLSRAPRPLMLPGKPAHRYRQQVSMSPERNSDLSVPDKMTIQGVRSERHAAVRTSLESSAVGQQTKTPVLVKEDDTWSSVTEFLTYTKEKYKPLFLQLAGRDRERITRESLTQYFLLKSEGKSFLSDAESPLSEDYPPLPRLRTEFPAVPSFQVHSTPLHTKQYLPSLQPPLITSLLVLSTQKLFTDGHTEWILYDQFIAILVMFEYTWNGFPLKRKAERVHLYAYIDDLTPLMKI